MKRIELQFLGAIVTVTMAINAYGQSSVSQGLVGWYPLDSNANDASGNGNNGIASAVSPAPDRFGNPGAAYQFDSTNSVVTIAPLSSTNLTELSLSVWIKPTAVPAVQGDIINKWRAFSYSLEDYALTMNSDLTITFGNGRHGNGYFELPNHCGLWSTRPVVLGKWHHIVATLDASGTATLWINGVQSGTDYVLTLLPPASEPVRVGQLLVAENSMHNGGIFDAFSGLIDDVRIYNRALSSNEVQQLYLAQAGPSVSLIKSVQPALANLATSSNYQLQVSMDLSHWTNSGAPFTATNSSLIYPQSWEVDSWNQLFFRVQPVP